MREHRLEDDVLDEPETDPDMHVLDVERVLTTPSHVHHADFVEVLPEFHLAGVGTEFVEVASEELIRLLD